MIKLEELIDQVLAIDSSKSRSDVLLDLKYTKSVEETINRIFDGHFLKGVQHIPHPTKTTNDTCIILDSDEEEEENKGSELDLPELPKGVVSSPPLRKEINFSDDDDDNGSPITTKKSDYSAIGFSDNELTTDKRTSDGHLLPSSPIKGIGTDDMLDLLDDFPSTSNKKKYAFQDDESVLSAGSNNKKKYMNEDDEDLLLPSPKKGIEKSITLDSLEDSPILLNKKKYIYEDDDDITKNSPLDDEFSSISNRPLDDDNDVFLIDYLDSEPHIRNPSTTKRLLKQSSPDPSESNNSVSLVDSDSEEFLPSMNDFFDQLLSQKREREVIEIEDVPDRKGKRRAYEYNVSPPPPARIRPSTSETTSVDNDNTFSPKERKELEAGERKRFQAEERKRAAEEKKLQRAQLREEKKRTKELKQLEKERSTLLEKENRIKSNRNEILKEMIVDMHPDFLKTKAGELLKLVLDKKEAQTQLMELANNKYHITWRRICTSEWNPDTMTFVPFATSKIVKEPYVLVYVDIYEFVEHVKADTADTYIDEIQRSDGNNRQIMLLIEGLEVYYKKKQLLRRRQFDKQIRSYIEGSSTTTTTSNRRKNNQAALENGPDREQVEECINYLQFMRDIMFVLTKDDEDTASWIESLTTDLALGRYKTKNINNSYKIGKCGTDPSDNFHKMLQEIQLCTPAIASSVMSEYPTLQSLHKAYERKDKANGEALLANLEVERSALQARDRKINRVMSKKIYTIFNSNDPDQIIY